jgi:hypothetical protein
MAMNRVQFQPGLSMFEFLERYGTEQLCEQAVFSMRWPEGFVCPRCEDRRCFSFRRGRQPYRQCAGCAYQCSLIVGTLFESTKLPLTRWFMVGPWGQVLLFSSSPPTLASCPAPFASSSLAPFSTSPRAATAASRSTVTMATVGGAGVRS